MPTARIAVRFAVVSDVPVKFAPLAIDLERFVRLRFAFVKFVPCMMVLARFVFVRFAPVRFAPERCARQRLIPERLRPERSWFHKLTRGPTRNPPIVVYPVRATAGVPETPREMTSLSTVFEKFAPAMFTFRRYAPVRFEPERFAFDKSAPVRFAVERSRPDMFLPARLRSDGTSGWYHEARTTGAVGADAPDAFLARTVIEYTSCAFGSPVIAHRVFWVVQVYVEPPEVAVMM